MEFIIRWVSERDYKWAQSEAAVASSQVESTRTFEWNQSKKKLKKKKLHHLLSVERSRVQSEKCKNKKYFFTRQGRYTFFFLLSIHFGVESILICCFLFFVLSHISGFFTSLFSFLASLLQNNLFLFIIEKEEEFVIFHSIKILISFFFYASLQSTSSFDLFKLWPFMRGNLKGRDWIWGDMWSFNRMYHFNFNWKFFWKMRFCHRKKTAFMHDETGIESRTKDVHFSRALRFFADDSLGSNSTNEMKEPFCRKPEKKIKNFF